MKANEGEIEFNLFCQKLKSLSINILIYIIDIDLYTCGFALLFNLLFSIYSQRWLWDKNYYKRIIWLIYWMLYWSFKRKSVVTLIRTEDKFTQYFKYVKFWRYMFLGVLSFDCLNWIIFQRFGYEILLNGVDSSRKSINAYEKVSGIVLAANVLFLVVLVW